ncbi:hypothetical protein [Paenibacillus sp. BR1-192]|uniref:hypothetical protein n=1 Tax=Paenibacillus sp. BR1-192 TaxID=3032287 RepID=UPI00240E33B9|nr:hypothetical protein [Paenibacillus sp. BR1-192]WFB60589.1 hypothetical protein P0X86_10450 [Paenibacillus sp. BR1-192]
MIQVGRMIFYDKGTGQVLVTAPSQEGSYVYENPEDLIPLYPELKDRDRSSFDIIQLEYGQYDEDFSRATKWEVDRSTLSLVFRYHDPNNPEVPQPLRKPLTEEVDELNSTIGTLLMESANDKATIASLEDTVGTLLFEVAALKGGAE